MLQAFFQLALFATLTLGLSGGGARVSLGILMVFLAVYIHVDASKRWGNLWKLKCQSPRWLRIEYPG